MNFQKYYFVSTILVPDTFAVWLMFLLDYCCIEVEFSIHRFLQGNLNSKLHALLQEEFCKSMYLMKLFEKYLDI